MALSISELQPIIEHGWETRAEIHAHTAGEIRTAVNLTIDRLDKGEIRVAEKIGNKWQVNGWIKQAILLSFRLNESRPISGGPGGCALVR